MAIKSSANKPTMISQTTVIAVVMIALLVGWVVGYAVASNDDDTTSASREHEVTDDATTSHSSHEMFAVDAETAPSVKVLADADQKGGWNITLVTENFTFTPQVVGEADVEGTGHAHIWVDGVKVGRVYGNNYYLGAQGEGDHEIKVTLNTNQHKDYAVDGVVISDSISVTEIDSNKAMEEASD